MIMGFISRWLGIDNLSPVLEKSIATSVLINAFRAISHNLFIITSVLYFLDTLEPLQVGLIWGAFFITQALLDYPTGNLGDAVGYKTILLTGYIFQIIAVPFLLFDDRIKYSPLELTSIFAANLVFMIIYAIGTSQESGALEAWLDNRYRVMSDDDSNREMYKHFQAKAGLIHNVIG